MGIKAKYTTTCDGCGKVVELELTPDSNLEDYNEFELFGPGLPDGWWQSEEEDGIHRVYHSKDCLSEWLIAHGRASEAEELLASPMVA